MLFSIFLIIPISSLFSSVIAQSIEISCSDVLLDAEKVNVSREGVNYEKYKIKNLDYQLKFTISGGVDLVHQWFHNDEELNIPNGEVGHLYYLQVPESNDIVLHFKKPTSKYSGIYKLVVKNKTGSELGQASCSVTTEVPMLDLSYETIRETEGTPAKIECSSSSMPKPKSVDWMFYEGNGAWKSVENATYEEINGIQKGLLKIDSLSSAHEGFYKCFAQSDTAVYVVRVRNPNAVYWPLIGIAIEVLILLITILVYEKKQYDKRKLETVVDEKALSDETAQPLMQSSNEKKLFI